MGGGGEAIPLAEVAVSKFRTSTGRASKGRIRREHRLVIAEEAIREYGINPRSATPPLEIFQRGLKKRTRVVAEAVELANTGENSTVLVASTYVMGDGLHREGVYLHMPRVTHHRCCSSKLGSPLQSGPRESIR